MHFFPLTFDRIEIEQCGWSQCISLAGTHRLICNMTYLGQDVTSSDLDLRSNFDLDFPRTHVYISTRVDEGNTTDLLSGLHSGKYNVHWPANTAQVCIARNSCKFTAHFLSRKTDRVHTTLLGSGIGNTGGGR